MIKGYKIRIYPTAEQEQLMWQHIGSCRFIWNYMLDHQQKLHEQGEKHLSAFGMINLLKPLKQDGEHAWLYDVSNTSLQRTCSDLQLAYDGFFKKTTGFPKFKSRKKSKPGFPICVTNFYFKDVRLLNIEKIGKVRYRTDFSFPFGKGVQKYSNARVSYKTGKWFVSFGMECENQAPVLTDTPLGIDLGTHNLAIAAYGDQHIIFHNINKSAQMQQLYKKLQHVQRSISRKYEASKKRTGKYEKTNNIIREEDKARRIHNRIYNIRHNYIHQTTHALIELHPRSIAMEDLNVTGMMKNKHLSRSIHEACWSEFLRQMQYKSEWNGIPFTQVDRFYPSSKTCSNCGGHHRDLKQGDRVFICPHCGFVIDRDFNAAINLQRHAA